MFVLRALFWLSVVALFMPRGPVLDIDTSQIRTALMANEGGYHLVESLPRDIFKLHIRTAEAQPQPYLQLYRNAVLSRLELARTELMAARLQNSSL